MSRIGNKPIPIPPGVEIEIRDNWVKVKGPKGTLEKTFPPEVTIAREDGQIVVQRSSDTHTHRALHGLVRALLANMVQGVTQGFRKELEIQGVGYRAEVQGKKLVLWVGYSHPAEIDPPSLITISVDRATRNIVVEGADKELVGEIAARIRRVRPPEPYKGKGIRYVGERVRRKAGKAGKVGAA